MGHKKEEKLTEPQQLVQEHEEQERLHVKLRHTVW
jgi:hypothetical protein